VWSIELRNVCPEVLTECISSSVIAAATLFWCLSNQLISLNSCLRCWLPSQSGWLCYHLGGIGTRMAPPGLMTGVISCPWVAGSCCNKASGLSKINCRRGSPSFTGPCHWPTASQHYPAHWICLPHQWSIVWDQPLTTLLLG